MEKDKRYKGVKRLLESGDLTEFNQIFEHIPKSVIASAIGTARDRFNFKMEHIEKFTLEDLIAIGKYLEVDDMMIVFQLAWNQYQQQKKKKRK